jgi:hypothetical protein
MNYSEALAGSKPSPIIWVLGACFVGFLSSVLFAGALRLPRNRFLIPYVTLVGIFALIYLRMNHISFRRFLTTRWKSGLVGALICGGLVAQNIISQSTSEVSRGWTLLFDLLWSGIAYGVADSLLLSVIPMNAVVADEGNGLLAVCASLAATVTYHLGYPEFQGWEVVAPVIGNGILAVGYSLSKSPIAPVGAHVIMHVAAVLHGPATTVQLPPHY